MATTPRRKPQKKNVKLQKNAAIEPVSAKPHDFLRIFAMPPATARIASMIMGMEILNRTVATQAGIFGMKLLIPPMIKRATTTHKAHTPAIISRIPAVVDFQVLSIGSPPALFTCSG